VTLAIGRLNSVNGAHLGTVFAVPGRLALTAFHCVGDRSSGRLRNRRVRCEWPGAASNAAVDDSDILNDVALLRLDNGLPSGLEPVFLTRNVTEHSRFDVLGYPVQMPRVSPFTVSGEITSLSGTLDGSPVLQLRCRESGGELSLRGMSGAPVLAGQPRRAVGILRWNQPRSDHDDLAAGETAFATPSTAVLQRWLQLWPPRLKAEDLQRIVRSLADRRRGRKPGDVRSYVWQLLLSGDLGLDEDDLEADLEVLARGHCHIAVPRGRALIEITADLRADDAVAGGERRLQRYLEKRTVDPGARHFGILTDGSEWRLYHRVNGTLRQAQPAYKVGPAKHAAGELVSWLEGILATARDVGPTPREITRRLGSESPSYAVDSAELADIYLRCRDMPAVRVRREMWAKLLTTASGTQFAADNDALFVDHTLLVAMAEVICHAVLGFDAEDEGLTAKEIMSGARLAEIGIAGVVEPDFFDWVAETSEGSRFVKDLARRLARFDWNEVKHDVMKALYQSIIPDDVRRKLGEYYTPDWLAEAVVAHCVTAPLTQRVLDPSCGSGTFLFHAIRRFLAAAEDSRMTGPEAVEELTKHVSGFDVHPVAVTLARVTYLLAIGMDRLKERAQFAVPVYLCDSLRWGQHEDLYSYKGLSVRTTLEHADLLYDPEFTGETDFRERLKFPDEVLADAGKFDGLVRELADKATDTDKRRRATLAATFQRFGVPEDSRAMIGQSFRNMCDLHDYERDHIWGYYVRNLARPVWMARPDNRVDVLVGNPPWLSYRDMTKVQTDSFANMSRMRNLWSGASLATSNNLAALFVARSIELYLQPEGCFGFVMPGGTLALKHYERFRRGQYSHKTEQVTVAFDTPWDLDRIKPPFFRLPVAAVFGRRTSSSAARREMGTTREEWSGYFAETKTASLAEATPHITRKMLERRTARQPSPYMGRFFQGAAVVPQVLFLVDDEATGRMGAGSGRRAIRSHRSAGEKQPWKSTPSLRGVVEEQFVKYLYLGSSLLPFRLLPPRQAVIPWDGCLVDEASLDQYPGLLAWWRGAESIWREQHPDAEMSLLQQLNYHQKLSRQFPVATYRVVYPKSAMYCAAAVISNQEFEEAIIDQQLYWGQAVTLDEARYLSAVLNAPVLTLAVRELQPRGERNPRDIAKYVFQLPIPAFDRSDAAHRSLVALATRAEYVASAVDLPEVRFAALRRRVRDSLAKDGVTSDIDAIVGRFLAA
jgi:Trypsin-like peptidase domain/Eco57I restriction-modification methylase